MSNELKNQVVEKFGIRLVEGRVFNLGITFQVDIGFNRYNLMLRLFRWQFGIENNHFFEALYMGPVALMIEKGLH